MSGTWLYRPDAIAPAGASGITVPSITGPQASPVDEMMGAALTRSWMDLPRRQVTCDAGSVHSADLAKDWPLA